MCNKEIKFKVFLEKALSLEADWLATGHYAQVKFDGKEYQLCSKDKKKDQSYFLCMLQQFQLEKTLFPIGHLTKESKRNCY